MKLQIELEQVLGRAARDEPARELDVLGGERVGDILRRDAEGRHSGGEQIHANGAIPPPADAHFAHAVDRLEALLDDVDRVLVELLLRAIALQRGPKDRLRVGLDLGDDRRIGVLWKPPQHLIDFRLDFVEGDVDSLVEVEGDVDD